MNETVTNLVDAIKSGDALATEQAFADAMAEKLSSKIEDLRVNIAQNMFGEQAEEIEEEQLDELSIQTMKSAKDKLAGKAIAAHYDDNKVAARNLANRALKIGRKVDRKEWERVNQKRLDQTAKYQKEEFELNLEDYSLEEIEDFMMSEDFEQLDELSKDTLKSYIDKTKDPERKGSLANIVDKQGRKGMKSPEFKKRLAHQQKAVDKWWNPDYGFKGTKDE